MTFTILSLLILFSAVAAQTQPPPPPPLYTFHPSIPTIVVMVLAMIFFIGFFSLYLRLCSGSSANQLLAAAASLRSRSPGLDAATVASFPVFHYYEVKELKIGKNALECAICLNEFEDDETLRLLPDCDHVFHPECIDAWLQSHVTCPVCRANLLPFSSTENPLPNQLPPAQPALESISIRGIVIDPVESESDSVPPREGSISRRIGFLGKSVHVPQAQTCEQRIYGKFPRSHSTGHSLVRSGENTDRFTLRFPEHVRKEVMTRALIRTATFNQTTEGSSRRSRRGGEGSSRGARSYKRLDREVKSDRWVITMPFSFGEGSVGRGKTAVKLPSFKCLEPGTSGDSVGQTRPALVVLGRRTFPSTRLALKLSCAKK